MIELKDRIYTDCISASQYDINIGDAKQGYQDWSVIQDGNTVYYCIIDDTDWEVGHGIKSGDYIVRNLISSSTGEKIEIGGSASVFCTYPAEKSVFLDVDGNLPVSKDIIAGGLIESNSLVKAPMIVTDAVLVGGNAEEDGSEITELLDVYTKGEVDKLQEEQDEEWAESQSDQDKRWDESQKAQDTKIDKNKTDIKTNKDKIAENKSSIEGLAASLANTDNNVIELEEEIEALAPSFDRGHWEHDPVEGMAGGAPMEGGYYLAGDSAQIVQKFEDTHQIYFHNEDSENPPQTHTFDDVTEGMYVELFEGSDSSFLLGVVETVTKGTTHTVVDVTVVKAEGGPGVEEEQPENPEVSASGAPGVIRVKFFNLTEGEINLDGYMQTSGGTFTGQVKHKKDIIIEPTMPSRFVNIKNRYATNPDGSDAGAGGTAFGINFDLDHGNSGYNQVKWTTRAGDILNISGGSRAWAKYRGEMTEDTNLVNKLYVDNAIKDNAGANSETNLHTLTSAGNTIKYVPASKSLNFGEFGATSANMGSNKNFYFYKLYSANGATVDVKNYEATESTMLEIWTNGELVVKTALHDWQQSSYSSADIQAKISGFKVMTSAGNLNTSANYGVVLSGLKKK